jgi:Bacteriocin-protection, YdeI or OmpD-Associated/Domain of unknown function (DUF1905)
VKSQKFRATLVREGTSTYVEIPFDVPAVLGAPRAPIAGTINGTEFRSRVAVYGGKYYLGLNKDVRTRAGVEPGDNIAVEMWLDVAERTVEVPEDLSDALSDAGLSATFAELSFTHKREYVEWINEAVRADTRARRITKMMERLRSTS